MSSIDYWVKRKVEFVVSQLDKAEQTAEVMKRSYAKAQKYLVDQTDKIFLKYQRDYKLSETQARELLKRSGVDVMKLKRELQNGVQSDEIKQILTDMDSVAYASRIEKLIQSQKDIDALMVSMYQNDNRLLTNHLKSIAEDSYLHEMFLIQTRAKVAFEFSALDPKYVDKLLRVNWSGKHFSQAIWNNHAELGQTLKEEYLVNYLTGRSSFDMAKVIEERFGVEGYKARRLVRTESTFFSAELEAKAYEEAGIEKYEYVSVLDDRTTHICKSKDGKIYNVKDRRAGVNYPPLHVFCRATTIANISNEWLQEVDGDVFDDTLGYKEWKKNNIDNSNSTVYNKSMKHLDLMAKTQLFENKDIRVNAKKILGSKYDFWVQNNTKKIRDAVYNVTQVLDTLDGYKIPRIVFVKKNKLPGYAGYDNINDILFITDNMSSEVDFIQELSSEYFAAKDIKETIIHELTHKQHWDSAKSFYKANKKSYNNVNEAMNSLNADLNSYVKQQIQHDYNYLYKISENAAIKFYENNINELVADVMVLGDNVFDKVLLEKVKEVLKWK